MSVGHTTPLDVAIAALVNGRNRDPFAVLGPHPDESGSGVVIRAFNPAARSIDLRLPSGEFRPMNRRNPTGVPGVAEVYEARVGSEVPDYRLRVTYAGGHVVELDDPYRYGRV